MRTFTSVLILLLATLNCLLGQTNWTSLNGPWYASDPRDIAIANNGTMFTIGGTNREIMKSTDQGTTWNHLSSVQDSVYCIGVKPDDDQIIILGMADESIRRTTNGGSSWVTVKDPSYLPARANRIVFSTSSTSYVLLGIIKAGTSDEHLYYSGDAGAAWDYVANFNWQTTVTDIVFNSSIIYVTGASGGTTNYEEGVFRSSDGGTNWAMKNSGISGKDIGSIVVDPSDNTKLFCCTYSTSVTFKVYKSTNSGVTWVSTTTDAATPNPGGRKLIAHSSSNMLVATTNGVWRTTNSGSNWSIISTSGLVDYECQWLASYASGGTTYYFLGTRNLFYRSTDIGVNWSECSKMTKAPVSSFVKRNSNLFALGTPGSTSTILYKSSNGGTDWFSCLVNYIPGTTTVFEGNDVAVNATNLIVCGEKSSNGGPVILVSTDSGATWPTAKVYAPSSVTGTCNQIVLTSTDNTFYGIGQLSSASPTGVQFSTASSGTTWNTSPIASYEFKTLVLDPTNTDIRYAGGTNGVYKTTDYGSSWTQQGLSGKTVNSLAINPLSGLTDTVYAGTTSYGVYKTVDAGSNWSQLASATPNSSCTVNYLFLHPLNTSAVYATGIDGSTPFIRKFSTSPTGTITSVRDSFQVTNGATFNRVNLDPSGGYKVLLATSDGAYGRIHQWQGSLDASATWSSSDSINIGYIYDGGCSGTVYIPQYKTLTIQSGTLIKFLSSGSASSSGILQVQGTLDAQGTYGNKIYFAPRDSSLGGGTIEITTGTATIKYCDFYRMYIGLKYNTASNPGIVSYSTFRETKNYGIYYSNVSLGSPSVKAFRNRFTGNLYGLTMYHSNVGVDSSYFSGNTTALWVWAGTPGFRYDTVETNTTGVLLDSSSARFGGYTGTEAGNNIIRNNTNEVIAEWGSSPFFGDGTNANYGNRIYKTSFWDEIADGVRISATHGSTVTAQYVYWGGSCPPPSSYFSTSGGSTIDYTNCLGVAAPTLLAPIAGAHVPKAGATLRWTDVPGAYIFYRMQLAKDRTFLYTSIEYDFNYTGDTTSSTSFATTGWYYWRVATKQAGGGGWLYVSSWAVDSFYVDGPITAQGHLMNEDKPTIYQLQENYPNPFNPSTQIQYSLPEDQHVVLKVYNTLGNEVATLVDGFEASGYKTVKFDASNLSSGMYFYRIQAGKFSDIKKMLLVK